MVSNDGLIDNKLKPWIIGFHNSEYGSWFQVDNIDKDKNEPRRITHKLLIQSWDESGDCFQVIVNRNEIEIMDWLDEWHSLEWALSYSISMKCKSG